MHSIYPLKENILCIQYIHPLSHNVHTPYNFGICTLNILRMRIHTSSFSQCAYPYKFLNLCIKQCKKHPMHRKISATRGMIMSKTLRLGRVKR